mgnify:CR=1 FL=1
MKRWKAGKCECCNTRTRVSREDFGGPEPWLCEPCRKDHPDAIYYGHECAKEIKL